MRAIGGRSAATWRSVALRSRAARTSVTKAGSPWLTRMRERARRTRRSGRGGAAGGGRGDVRDRHRRLGRPLHRRSRWLVSPWPRPRRLGGAAAARVSRTTRSSPDTCTSTATGWPSSVTVAEPRGSPGAASGESATSASSCAAVRLAARLIGRYSPPALDRHRATGRQHDLGHVVAPEELDQLASCDTRPRSYTAARRPSHPPVAASAPPVGYRAWAAMNATTRSSSAGSPATIFMPWAGAGVGDHLDRRRRASVAQDLGQRGGGVDRALLLAVDDQHGRPGRARGVGRGQAAVVEPRRQQHHAADAIGAARRPGAAPPSCRSTRRPPRSRAGAAGRTGVERAARSPSTASQSSR
jgi:hypothetical protein